jgi:hypothetical protein
MMWVFQPGERLTPLSSGKARGRHWRCGLDLNLLGPLLCAPRIVTCPLRTGRGVLRRRLSAARCRLGAVRSRLSLLSSRPRLIRSLSRSSGRCNRFVGRGLRLVRLHTRGIGSGLSLRNGLTRRAPREQRGSDHNRQDSPREKAMHIRTPSWKRLQTNTPDSEKLRE